MTPRNVPCPKCNAGAGQRCITTGRSARPKKRKAHSARRRLAKGGAP